MGVLFCCMFVSSWLYSRSCYKMIRKREEEELKKKVQKDDNVVEETQKRLEGSLDFGGFTFSW